MTALQHRFQIKSERTTELGYEVENAYDTLHDALNQEQQRLLLRYIDAEECFRDAETLDAFVSGFKLADGIRQELGAPYDYEVENEARVQERFRQTYTESQND